MRLVSSKPLAIYIFRSTYCRGCRRGEGPGSRHGHETFKLYRRDEMARARLSRLYYVPDACHGPASTRVSFGPPILKSLDRFFPLPGLLSAIYASAPFVSP